MQPLRSRARSITARQVSYSTPEVVSGTVEAGSTITIRSNVGSGGKSDDEVVLMIGSDDHSICFGGNKYRAVWPGRTLEATATIPSDFQGVVAAGIELRSPGGPCDSWLEGIGLLDKVTLGTVGERPFDPGRVTVSNCRVTGSTDFSIDVSVDVTNDNDQAIETGLNLVIGNLDVHSQPDAVSAGGTATITRTFNLVNTQIQDLPGDGFGTHDYQLGLSTGSGSCQGTVTFPAPAPTEPATVESVNISATSPSPGTVQMDMTITATEGTQNTVRIRPFDADTDGFLADFEVTIAGGETTTITRAFEVPGGARTVCAQVGAEQVCTDIQVEPPEPEPEPEPAPGDGTTPGGTGALSTGTLVGGALFLLALIFGLGGGR